MFGVFDGATCLNGVTYDDDKTGGFYASRIARQVFKHNNDSLHNLSEKANSAIHYKMKKKGIKGGLPAIRNHVRRLESKDPECRIYPRFKPHDDIAAVAVSLLIPENS